MDSCRSGQFALLVHFRARWIQGTGCVIEWEKAFGESSSFQSFLLAYIILFIYIPVLLLVILYSIIVIKLKTQAHPGEQSANTQQQRDRRNRNVLQMYIATVTVFVCCWLLYGINFLIIWDEDSSTHFSCSFWIYYEVTFYMANAYCAINPVICFMFSSNYRKVLKRRTGVWLKMLRVRGWWNSRE